ncbi:MAG: hypothetical protein JSR54_13110, partial [Proteobacteria bacterium]|nr:hypothetical protein [Pseudomonadota bacterium]
MSPMPWLMLAIVAASGCTLQAYSGAPQGRDDTAQLRGRYTYFVFFDTHIEVLALDGK